MAITVALMCLLGAALAESFTVFNEEFSGQYRYLFNIPDDFFLHQL